jgi:hypothetical protein
VERCLACEAVVNNAHYVTRPSSATPFCVNRQTLRYRAPTEINHVSRFIPVHHGLASEAALHGWRPLLDSRLLTAYCLLGLRPPGQPRCHALGELNAPSAGSVVPRRRISSVAMRPRTAAVDIQRPGVAWFPVALMRDSQMAGVKPPNKAVARL